MALPDLLLRRIHPEVDARVERLELPWNRHGIDPYGVSKEHLARSFTMLGFMYRHYFSVDVHGIQHVPPRGRAIP